MEVMPFRITEFFDSRKLSYTKDSERADLTFVGYGTDDDGVARAAFDNEIGMTFAGITGTLARVSLDVVTIGGLFWRASATYMADPAPLVSTIVVPGDDTPLDASFSFDFMGTTEHITQSIANVSCTARVGYEAADTKGAIGVTADGHVLGCDKPAPSFTWTREVTFPFVTMALLKAWSALVGTTNQAAFYTYPAESSVFLGGQCTIKDVSRAVVTFKFTYVPNESSITICDGLASIVKKGAEFLWISYVNVQDGNQLTQQPSGAYVERVCKLADWSLLGIGT